MWYLILFFLVVLYISSAVDPNYMPDTEYAMGVWYLMVLLAAILLGLVVEQVVISQIRKRVPRLPVMRLSESTLSPAPRGRTMFASVSVVRAHQLQGIAFLHMTVINAQDYDSSFSRFVGGRRGFCNGVSFGVDRQELLTNAADILFGEFAAEWTRMNGQLATKSIHRRLAQQAPPLLHWR